jgi:hypothetical protein
LFDGIRRRTLVVWLAFAGAMDQYCVTAASLRPQRLPTGRGLLADREDLAAA